MDGTAFEYEKYLYTDVDSLLQHYLLKLAPKVRVFSLEDVYVNPSPTAAEIVTISSQLTLLKVTFTKNQQIAYMHEREFSILKENQDLSDFLARLENWATYNSPVMVNIYGVQLIKVNSEIIQVRAFYEPFSNVLSPFYQQSLINENFDVKMKFVTGVLFAV
jgi:hypothetical protein